MYLGFCIAILVLFIDQLTKTYVRDQIPPYHMQPFIGDFVRLTHVPNPGGIFGLSFGSTFPYDLVSILAIAFLLVLLLRERRKVNMVSYGLLLGGSWGNLFDRIFNVEITDFIDIGISETYRGLIFNLADLAIIAGLFVFLCATLVRNRLYAKKLLEGESGELPDSPD